MLIQYTALLNRKRIILASQSPRRNELLNNIGLKFEVSASTFDEKLPHAQFVSAASYAMETAKQKALEVANRISNADLVIGADTVSEFRIDFFLQDSLSLSNLMTQTYS
jgi:septum formation protein